MTGSTSHFGPPASAVAGIPNLLTAENAFCVGTRLAEDSDFHFLHEIEFGPPKDAFFPKLAALVGQGQFDRTEFGLADVGDKA